VLTGIQAKEGTNGTEMPPEFQARLPFLNLLISLHALQHFFDGHALLLGALKQLNPKVLRGNFPEPLAEPPTGFRFGSPDGLEKLYTSIVFIASHYEPPMLTVSS
jgi:hypothetical protein